MKFLIDRDNPKKPKRLRSENARELACERAGVGAEAAAAAEAAAEAEALEAAPFLDGLHSAFGDALLEAPPAVVAEAAADVKPSALVPPRHAPSWGPPPHHLDSWGVRRTSSKGFVEAPRDADDAAHEDYGARLAALGPGPGPGPGASDEAAVFGQYVAEKLRGYSRRTRAVVEHLVSNVLFEADMGKHDAPPQLLAQERAAGGHRLRGGRDSPPLVVTYSAPSPSPSRGPLDEDDEDDEDGGGGGEGDAEEGGAAVKLEPELDSDFDDERGGF